ncbi:DUF4129 domain-containing protein [Streptomyces sp. NPDC057428]|uniref:DUF4129 domain-containing protein n=1 Tax=Streptomyces sp. NPDC057428 TaxID=3346129 RepID=UPI0036C980B9
MGLQHAAGGRRRYSTIGALQAALTVLVVGGAALGALLLRPDTSLLAKGRGPLGANAVLVVGLALLSLLGGLALRGKYREQVGAARELNPVEQRMADGVSRILLAATLVVPLLIMVLHQFGPPRSSHGDDHESLPFPSPRQDPLPIPPPAQHAEHAGHSMHFGVTRILLGLGIALLVVVVMIAGLYLWRYLRRALLDGTDARAAVIAGYAAMEASLAGSGVTRRASDSPQDLLERAVAGGLPTEAAAAALTALFREARYSTHPMDGSHRDRAAAALAEIADSLRSRTSEPEAVTGTS